MIFIVLFGCVPVFDNEPLSENRKKIDEILGNWKLVNDSDDDHLCIKNGGNNHYKITFISNGDLGSKSKTQLGLQRSPPLFS